MSRSCGLRDKGIIYVVIFLKQKVTTTGAKIRRYKQRNLQYHQNNLFKNNQKQFYTELDGKLNEQTEAPDPTGTPEFWSQLWAKPMEHNRDDEWLKIGKDKLRAYQDRKMLPSQ